MSLLYTMRSLEKTTLENRISFQVATLPDVAGAPLSESHTYRFILDPPIIDTPYFAELYANTLPVGFSGSDHLGCFNADRNTLCVSGDVFLPYVAAQRPRRLSWWYHERGPGHIRA